MQDFNISDYNEVINGRKTYKTIADNLKNNHSTIIGWHDGDSTHYDILFTLGAVGNGGYQRGIRNTDLFVSVISVGSFGFKTDSLKDVGYIAEKLFNCRVDNSVEYLTNLINGVIKELNNGFDS